MIRRSRTLHEKRITKILGYLERHFYEDARPLQAEVCNFGDGIVTFDNRLTGVYSPVAAGDSWGENFGKSWDHAWFHLQGAVPAEWRGQHVVALMHIGAEGTLFDNDGMPLSCITAFSEWDQSIKRERHELFADARGGEPVELWIEASVSLMYGINVDPYVSGDTPTKYGHHKAVVDKLNLAIWRKDIWSLHLDIETLFALSQALPEKSVRRDRILHALNAAIDVLEFDPATIQKCRDLLRPELEKRANDSALTAWCVGHAHIDTAWLWPYEESIRKCARTFSAQVMLNDKYPEFIFGASQAQHYAMTKENYPKLYQRIKEKIRDRKWEVQGAMWVEADCNLSGGESLVRQVLHGKNYFMDEFGEDVRNLWLPDVFGYSAALPQILKKAGVDYFVTQKISWNQFNKFPHHTFFWQGIDGSSVLTHFPPEDTYNSSLKADRLMYAEENFQEKAVLDNFLTLFGIGDGGGGPREEFIERGLRMRNLEGAPRVRFDFAQKMLDRLQESASELDYWRGELYLELHRGTLTTQAFNKKMNRKMELNLRELEVLYSALPLDNYPQVELDALWKEVLMNQFHDIIPGSSVHRVYVDSRRDYARMLEKCTELMDRFVALTSNNASDCVTVLNTLSSAHTREITLPGSWKGHAVLTVDGTPLESAECSQFVYVMPTIPGLSAITLYKGASHQPSAADCQPPETANCQPLVLENGLVRYELDANGQIVYGYDKQAGFAFIPRGMRGNVLNLYVDFPADWDAWDIDRYYERQQRATAHCQAITLLSDSYIAKVAQLDFVVGNSTLTQYVMLQGNSKRLEFSTCADWQEKHKLLKVEFEVAVQSEQATFEIQYGNVQRATHDNTSWEYAQFEVCGHRWVDLANKDYGVALLNDCKYGHRIHENNIELSLLRAPNNPDPEADIGQHQFSYALLPHCENLDDSTVIAEAAQFNQKARVLPGKVEFNAAVRLISGEAIVEVVKKAEKSTDIIVRIYEPFGKKTVAKLAVANFVRASETDLMEWSDLRALDVSDAELVISLQPFEIFTIKLTK